MKKENAKRNKVIIAMSGGVDSSVAAAFLKRADYDVVGVFMKFWAPFRGATRINADSDADLRGYENRCCSSEAEARARKVAKILNIPFYVFNFEKEFKKRIVDYFLKEYKAGKTPNPCVVCNKKIKFGLLLEKALKLGVDFVATGHYVKKPKTKNQKPKTVYKLLKGKDKEKDQSYFLWQLNQKQLKHILFPVGDYAKAEVRKLAKKFDLPTFETPESQEICFVQTTIDDFLKKYLRKKPGLIVDTQDRVLGKHEGLFSYTIGQRKGVGLSGGPYYVLDKDLKNNHLIVTKDEKDLCKKELIVKNVNWISGKEPRLPLKVKIKIRYRSELVSAAIYKMQNTKYKIRFGQPQRAITPGQSAVFYHKEELLGGGIIC